MQPDDSAEKGDAEDDGKDDDRRVIQLQPRQKGKEPLPWRLEEIRRTLAEAESVTPSPDQEAINSPEVFYDRFGFKWPKEDRQALIDLKGKYGMTDREIRVFHSTGNLSRRGGVVRLTAYPSVALAMGLMIGVLSVLASVFFLGAGVAFFNNNSSWVIGLAFGLALVALMAWGYWAHIDPYFAQRRAKQRRPPDE